MILGKKIFGWAKNGSSRLIFLSSIPQIYIIFSDSIPQIPYKFRECIPQI